MYKSLKTDKKEQNEQLEQLTIVQFFFEARKYSGYKMHPKHATDLELSRKLLSKKMLRLITVHLI